MKLFIVKYNKYETIFNNRNISSVDVTHKF